MKKKFGLGQEGFTLIELVIVIAVLAALAGVVVPAVNQFLRTAQIAAANTEVQSVKTGCTAYLADEGGYPDDSFALLTVETGGSGYYGPSDYLSDKARALYYFDGNGQIEKVDHITGGWGGDSSAYTLVFDISDQLWVKGDNEAGGGNQDRP